ncbi:Hypothetical predicted protein, partial [Olea europaea subsp. europaea]
TSDQLDFPKFPPPALHLFGSGRSPPSFSYFGLSVAPLESKPFEAPVVVLMTYTALV